MKACNVEKRDDGNWCLDHQRFHDGHLYDISQQLTPLAQSYRDLWSGDVKPKRLLRSLPMAKQCMYLGEPLTAEEVKEKRLLGCNSCSGAKAHHCKLPSSRKFNDGPYCRVAGECTNCTDWKKKEAEPGEMSWEPIRFDHLNLHPGVIPGVRFNSSIIEST